MRGLLLRLLSRLQSRLARGISTMLAPTTGGAKRRGTGFGRLSSGSQLSVPDLQLTLSEDPRLQSHGVLSLPVSFLLSLQFLA